MYLFHELNVMPFGSGWGSALIVVTPLFDATI